MVAERLTLDQAVERTGRGSLLLPWARRERFYRELECA